jgi:hypothetical protein
MPDVTTDSLGYREPAVPPRFGQKALTAPTQHTLKRHRSPGNINGVPPLPELTGDVLLEVFTHRSLRFSGAPMNDEFGDSERLAILGAEVMELITTYCLFCKRPMLKADEIEVCITFWYTYALLISLFLCSRPKGVKSYQKLMWIHGFLPTKCEKNYAAPLNFYPL